MAVEIAMTVQDLPRSEWTILYYFYAISATSKPAVLHCSLVCQEPYQYLYQMFATD